MTDSVAGAGIPTDYLPGYETARRIDADLADLYVAHTMIGDPLMDDLLDELDGMDDRDVHRLIQAGMEQQHDKLKGAPRALRDFFVDSPPPDPSWHDPSLFAPGVRAFQRQAPKVLAAFVAGVLIDGFSTLIAKSFVATGRIFDNGVWRLKQNNRQQMEIFFPGGLERYGDGWKLSVRIRFVHGQVRRLLAQSDDWDAGAWGVPISAAHLGYSLACFSARTVIHSKSLGARFSPEEEEGFLAVWRYAGHLMGIPDSIIYTDESDALNIYRVGGMCEPPPTMDSIVMTNALVNSAPLVAGIEDREEREKLVKKIIYPVSRALVGHERADQLNFPRRGNLLTLPLYRLGQRVEAAKSRFKGDAAAGFSTLLAASAYEDAGLSYRLPTHVHDEESKPW